MRVVIHDEETYEPLTVVTIANHFLREMEIGDRDRSLRLPIPLPVSPFYIKEPIPTKAVLDVVRLRFEPIYKGDRRLMWLCTAEDGESALLLRSTFLPGQQKDVHAIERQAYLRGVLEALT